jgi:hypothetical protein
MLHDRRARSRVSRQRPDVAVAALVQDPIAHSELIASALFGSCCGSCRLRPALVVKRDKIIHQGPPRSRWRALTQLNDLFGLFVDHQTMATADDEREVPSPNPSRSAEALRIIEEYAADLREILKKLRRKLN